VQRCMEEAAKLDLPLPVSVQVGERIGSLQPYPPGGAEPVRPTAIPSPALVCAFVCRSLCTCKAMTCALGADIEQQTSKFSPHAPVGWPTAMAPGCASVGAHHYHHLDLLVAPPPGH
jgi:hypothetical protein